MNTVLIVVVHERVEFSFKAYGANIRTSRMILLSGNITDNLFGNDKRHTTISSAGNRPGYCQLHAKSVRLGAWKMPSSYTMDTDFLRQSSVMLSGCIIAFA
jgi:hypothetical protein